MCLQHPHSEERRHPAATTCYNDSLFISRTIRLRGAAPIVSLGPDGAIAFSCNLRLDPI